ncbi:NfeD family protein [bacterium]|nr:NfeD family protein [bacterium]
MGNEQNWLNSSLIWFVVGLIFILIEFASPGIILIFFGLGSWVVASLCLLLDISLNLQILIFILSSVVLLILLRERFQSLFQRRQESTPAEESGSVEFIGKKAIVTETITPKAPGRVEFRGTYWTAQASESIAKNTPVEIVGKNNITLLVKPL